MIIQFFLYFTILYPEQCYMEENVTYDSDNEIFPYSEDNTDEDYLIPRANDKKWILRVANGEPAKLGDIPYQVSLKKLKKDGFYRSFCGASIIGEKKILTAAHCFLRKKLHAAVHTGTIERNSLTDIYAVAGYLMNEGINSLNYNSGQWRRLSSVRYPKNYKRPKHDIAVVYLDDPFVYNKYVGPIPIAIKNQDYKNACLVSGYGKTGRDKKISSDVLLKAYLTIMSSENCSELYQYNMETFICTGTQVPDVGRGDSGGPLVCTNTSDPNERDIGVLVGIVRAHSPNRSSLFVRVSQYYDFITKESTQFIENSDYGALHSMCNVYQPNFYFLFILELIFFIYYSEVFQYN